MKKQIFNKFLQLKHIRYEKTPLDIWLTVNDGEDAEELENCKCANCNVVFSSLIQDDLPMPFISFAMGYQLGANLSAITDADVKGEPLCKACAEELIVSDNVEDYQRRYYLTLTKDRQEYQIDNVKKLFQFLKSKK